MNEGLGFNWDYDFVDDVQYDYYSLSAEAEAFQVDENMLSDIHYYDAMARHLSESEKGGGR